jgi:hypothetical protein
MPYATNTSSVTCDELPAGLSRGPPAFALFSPVQPVRSLLPEWSERTKYAFPSTLLKEAQLSSLALSPPKQASLATVPPNPTQEFSITRRSSYARRLGLVAVTGRVRLHARTDEGASTMHGTYMHCGDGWLIVSKVQVHRTSYQVGRPAGRRTLPHHMPHYHVWGV